MKRKKKSCALYIHIPFCVRKCLYCDFLSMSAGNEVKEQYIRALLRELMSWRGILKEYCLHTIFVGGGTPTCLTSKQMEHFADGLLEVFASLEIADNLEFTMEANPGTILREHLPVMKSAGINRISLGLQSAWDRELQALGRIHTYREFLQSYSMLREFGFSNVNIDIMADIPLQTLESYEQTLEKVISLHPQHISAYSLIVEEGTPFYHMAEEGKLHLPDQETDRQMYRLTEEILKCAGYERYEISNYAIPGYACRHNLTYWNTEEYLGVGLGASSCLGGYRFKNTEDMHSYLSFFQRDRDFCTWRDSSDGGGMAFRNQAFSEEQKGTSPGLSWIFKEVEKLTETARKEEFMFLGLRKMEGVSKRDFEKLFGQSLGDVYGEVLPKLIEQRLVEESRDGERLFLTDRGIDVSNIVLAEFLLS